MVTQTNAILTDPRLEAPEEVFDPNPMRRVQLPDLAALYEAALPLARDELIAAGVALGLNDLTLRRDAQFSVHRLACIQNFIAQTGLPVTEAYTQLQPYDTYETELLSRGICPELIEDRRFVIGTFQTMARTMAHPSLAELNRAFTHHHYDRLIGLTYHQSEGVLHGLSREQVLDVRFDEETFTRFDALRAQDTPLEDAYNQALAAARGIAPLNGRVNTTSGNDMGR